MSTELILPPTVAAPSTKGARFPRMADYILNPSIPWRVGPTYASQPKFTANFAHNVRDSLYSPRCVILETDSAKEFLDRRKEEEWDVTRDIPQAKPIADIAFWEWRSPTPPLQAGVLCKGLIKRDLDSAIEELATSQISAFDYDVALALQSLRSARRHIDSDDVKAPVIALVGSVFELRLGPTETKKQRGKTADAHQSEICPVGTFALTLNSRGKPVQDSLVELTWDDANDAAFSRDVMLPRLRAATLDVLLMHTLFRALEAQTEPIDADDESGKGLFAERELVAHHHLDLRTLPKKLNEEAFAAQDGLKTAFRYTAGKWITPPVEWPK